VGGSFVSLMAAGVRVGGYDEKGVAVFAGKIWAHRPSALSLRGEYYEYLRTQPELVAGEDPVITVRNEEAVQGLLCLLKHEFLGGKVYAGANYFILPDAPLLSGSLLMKEWADRSDLMVSAGPSPATLHMYKQSGWEEVDCQYLWLPLRWRGLKDAGNKNYYFFDRIRAMGEYVIGRMRQYFMQYNSVQNKGWSDAQAVALLKTVSRDYLFFGRTAAILRWRYSKVPGRSFDRRMVYENDGKELIGWFVIAQKDDKATIAELWALPGRWDEVLEQASAVIASVPQASYGAMYANYVPLIEAARKCGWYKQRSGPVFFKQVRGSKRMGKAMKSMKFIFQASDGDDYLL
jgi:hypothetical protein